MKNESNQKKDKKQISLEKRKKLIGLSNNLKPLVNKGLFLTINDALRDTYANDNDEITEFNTFDQWRKKGFSVKKGSKAFLFWGQPLKLKNKNQESKGPQDNEINNFEFFPLCYLFSNLQVVDLNKIKQEKQEQEQEQKNEQEKSKNLEF